MLMLTTKLEHEQWQKISHIIGSHTVLEQQSEISQKLVRFRDPLDWDGEPDYQKMSSSMFGTTRPTRPYQEWSRGRQPQYSWKSAIGGRLDSEIGQNFHGGLWLTGDRPTTRISVSACFSMTKRTKSYKVALMGKNSLRLVFQSCMSSKNAMGCSICLFLFCFQQFILLKVKGYFKMASFEDSRQVVTLWFTYELILTYFLKEKEFCVFFWRL